MLQTFTRPFIQNTSHMRCALPSVTRSHGKILSTPEGPRVRGQMPGGKLKWEIGDTVVTDGFSTEHLLTNFMADLAID